MIKKIAITGSSGFIGSFFIKNTTEFSILEVDLLNHKIEDIDFTGVESVLHLAAIAHQKSLDNEELYYSVNRDLAFETAKRAKSQGVKQFVLMSTVKVYGEYTNNITPWDENSICSPVDVYGKSKHEAEALIRGLQDETFKVAIIRSPLVYGAGVKANMYNLIKLVDRFPIIPFKGINNKRSMVYIGNLIALIKQIINKQVSGIFIPADKEPLSTSQLCIYIAKSLNKRVWLIKIPKFLLNISEKIKPSIYNRLFGSLFVNNLKTNEDLQFLPPFSSEQGIDMMVKWFRETEK